MLLPNAKRNQNNKATMRPRNKSIFIACAIVIISDDGCRYVPVFDRPIAKGENPHIAILIASIIHDFPDCSFFITSAYTWHYVSCRV